MRKLMLVIILMISIIGIVNAEEEEGCTIFAITHNVIHEAVTHEVVIVDQEAWDEMVIDTEAWDEVVVDVPAHTEWELITPEVSVWKKGKNHKSGYEQDCGIDKSNCHKDVITPAVYDWVYYPEVSHVVHHDAVTHIVSHEAVTHVEVVVDEEEWTEVVIDVPAKSDKDCDGIPDEEDQIDNRDSDHDGLQNWEDPCPRDRTSTCVKNVKPKTSLEYEGEKLPTYNGGKHGVAPTVVVGNTLTIIWEGMYKTVDIFLTTEKDKNKKHNEVSQIAEDVPSSEDGSGSYDWVVEKPESDGLSQVKVVSEEDGSKDRVATSGKFQIVRQEVQVCQDGYSLVGGQCVRPETQFGGYTFGTSDCNRVAILLGQPETPRREYLLNIIAWDYKYTIPEMYNYCEDLGVDMTPVIGDYYTWNPQD
jgi:hypothetical protein